MFVRRKKYQKLEEENQSLRGRISSLEVDKANLQCDLKEAVMVRDCLSRTYSRLKSLVIEKAAAIDSALSHAKTMARDIHNAADSKAPEDSNAEPKT